MPNPHPTRVDDELVLKMLDLRHHEGLGMGAIGQRLGKSKGAVAGAFKRVRDDEVTDCRCVKAENKDGGMRRMWWRA